MSREAADNRKSWLASRLNGIGASEAAAIVGMSPYMSNIELWEIKTRRRAQEDISGKPYVKYGVEAEAHLRALFALDFPEYEVTYDHFGMVRKNPELPFAFATLDGELLHRETGRRGVLEIKTTEIMNPSQWEKWDGRIPDNYYVQVLHQLMSTGYDFAILKAQIKYCKGGTPALSTRHYTIERTEAQEDMEWLAEQEQRFWDCVIHDRRPNRVLPEI